jgi:hypothetical protein
MALSILDGNQSATTLSTILSSGQHITAHTVVSLGSQAITDIASGVSGSVVSISNFPATQPVSLVSVPTHGVTISNSSVTVNGTFYQSTQPVSLASLPSLVAGTAQIGSVTIGNSVTIASCVTHGVTIANTTVTVNGTFYQATQPVSLASLPSLVAGVAQIGSVTISNSTITVNGSFYQATQPVSLSSIPSAASLALPITSSSKLSSFAIFFSFSFNISGVLLVS